ncbi:MAG: BMP family ABC transporter substrate-binding protein [Chloroflexota bacterium]|nr:BMP family ABC transporter substrate-binding protein [Chloroflexota bacterium]
MLRTRPRDFRPVGSPLTVLLAILATVSSFGAGQSVTAQDGGIERVAIVTPASRTNQGWDQQGVDNLIEVGEHLGIEVEVEENAGYDDITPILNDLADDGVELIVCHASGYQTVCPEFAQSSGVPVVVIENPGAVEANLVADIETQAQEAAYLAGVVAGLETTTGTVAVVVSGEPPTWNYMTAGFAEGLHSVNPEATLLYQVIGEAAYDDAPNAKRVTESVIAAGADIVFGMGDGASFGMIQAINEHNQNVEPSEGPVRFIDVIGDKSGFDAGEYLLTSVLFDYRPAYTQLIQQLGDGTFGDVYTMSLENKGVRLLDMTGTAAAETVTEVEAVQAAIIDGSIEVPAIGDADGVHALLDELFPR